MKTNSRTFATSSHSGGAYCVGVAIEDSKVTVTNTKKQKTSIEFTKQEWLAFIKGVKDGEFDI